LQTIRLSLHRAELQATSRTLVQRARVAVLENELPEAIRLALEAVAAAPTDPYPAGFATYLLGEAGGDYDRASEIALHAHRANPEQSLTNNLAFSLAAATNAQTGEDDQYERQTPEVRDGGYGPAQRGVRGGDVWHRYQAVAGAAVAALCVAGCASGGSSRSALTAGSTCAQYNDASTNARARIVRQLVANAHGDLSTAAVAGYISTTGYECATNPDKALSAFAFARPEPSASPTPALEALGLQAGEDERISSDARVLFTYDYRTLAQAESAGLAISAEPFLSTYRRTFETMVMPVARDKRAVVVAHVVDVGVVSRTSTSTTYLAFVNQVTTSTLATTPKTDLSRVAMTTDTDGKVTSVEALGNPRLSTGGPPALAAEEKLAADAILPLLTIDSRSLDADLRAVLDHATGQFAADFHARSAQLRKTLLSNHVFSRAAAPLIAIVSADSSSVTVLAAADTTVTNDAAPSGRTNAYRIRAVLTPANGQLLISKLDFVG
jgi:hypothetical protein